MTVPGEPVTAGDAPFPVDHQPITPHGLRIDIQLLRALAVLLVVAHHARVPGISGGFLGVDIFFVISGYLMTGIIARELDERRFRFTAFYARRIRRLLPAAYATLTITAIAAPFLLDSFEYHDFTRQLIGSFGFFANVVLWKQANYFNTVAAMKPLLHMWSLSVEEQYYIVLPALLFACPSRLRLPLSVLAVIASAALYFVFLDRSSTGAFYLLPFRAWELGVGSVTALVVRAGLPARAMPPVRAVAALVLAVVPFLADPGHHAGLWGVTACLATAILLWPGLDIAERRWLTPMVAIGNRSYSLYLVHWPLFAFANNVALIDLPGTASLALVAMAFLWTEAQYRLVEQPLRAMRVGPRTVATLLLIPVLVIGGSFAFKVRDAKNDAMRAYNAGLSAACDSRDDFTFQPACRTGGAPQILVWGDSFAMHLVDGVVASTHAPIAQATRTVCAPFLGIAPIDGSAYPEGWAKRCISFNDSVIHALTSARSVRTVVLSSALAQYLGEEPGWQMMERAPGGYATRAERGDTLIAALARTVAAVRATGKRVVLVAPPPSIGIDLARCRSRLDEGKPVWPARTRCDFAREDYHRRFAANLDVLAEIERRQIVPVFRFDDALCSGAVCRTTQDGILLYRDGGHLSVPGSRLLGQRLGLAARLEAMAR